MDPMGIPAGHPGPSRRIFLSGAFLSPKRDPALKQSLAKSGRPAVVRRASASTFSDGFPVPEKKERSKPCHIRVFPKKGVPRKWMVKIMESPIKMDDLGVPPFSETSIPANRLPAIALHSVATNLTLTENHGNPFF